MHGLAISDDSGKSFQKVSEGPIADRSELDPYFNTAPSVLREGNKWQMWYVSCTGWEDDGNTLEPRYHVKYAHSSDGISWKTTGHVCIDHDQRSEAIGRPCVYKEGGVYKMLYSYRGLRNYRHDPTQSYRLGYAESPDGLSWTRRDEDVGIEPSTTGWDSEMIEYCWIGQYEGQTYLFYNGNGFGKTGFGFAVRGNS